MHQDRRWAENKRFVQTVNFSSRFSVGPFRCMQNKGNPMRRLAKTTFPVWRKFQRMRPAKAFQHANRKLAFKHVSLVWIVMRYGSDTREQVFDSTPKQAQELRNR